MSFWKRALDLLIDPNIIALMLSIGLLGIVVELWNPGLIFPGTVGAISLIVGLYGLQVLPVSVAGAVADAARRRRSSSPRRSSRPTARSRSRARVTFVIGALMLFDPAGEAYQVSLLAALAIAGTLALLLGVALTRVVRVARQPAEVGAHGLVGDEGEVQRDGLVLVERRALARAPTDGAPLVPGEHVRVEAVERRPATRRRIRNVPE